MTKHLDEARDRWAKEFKKRVKMMDEILSKEPKVDEPTPVSDEEFEKVMEVLASEAQRLKLGY